MPKKKKEETIEDILDRMEADIQAIRDKNELNNDDSDEFDEDFDDDSDDDSDDE